MADSTDNPSAVARRAFEQQVFELVRDSGPRLNAQFRESHGRDENNVFRSFELVGEYPKTRVRMVVYQRSLDREIAKQYWIWHPYFAHGDLAADETPDVEQMHDPEYIASEMLLWARGG